MANLLEAVAQLPLNGLPLAGSPSAGLPLSEMPMIAAKRHQTYRVSRVEGDSSDSQRLKALGFCEGREVQILRTGRSWIVRVLGSRVGLSSQLAAIVQLIPATT